MRKGKAVAVSPIKCKAVISAPKNITAPAGILIMPLQVLEAEGYYVTMFRSEQAVVLHFLAADYDVDIDHHLDEIRFHPPIKKWQNMEGSELEEIAKMDIDVGIEVPALPDHEEELSSLLSYAR